MTCGTGEENLDNNRRSTRGARRARATTRDLVELRDGHNWIAWRDSLPPAPAATCSAGLDVSRGDVSI